MGEPLLVFFDTFSVEEQAKNNLDCIRFSNYVSLSEIRIIPFGSVVESSLSDEAVIGTTNPASFNLKFYICNRSGSTTLELIYDYEYDESNGVCCINFPRSIPTNFLVLRGGYSTVTLAVFGLPFMSSLQQPGLAVPNFSVPPPPLVPVSCASVFPLSHVMNTCGTLQPNAAHIAQASSTSSWQTQRSILPTPVLPGKSIVPDSSNVDESLAKDSNEMVVQFEDGETQDFDYDAISSNDDMFSDIEDPEVSSAKNVPLMNMSDPQLYRCRWRFDPLSLLDLPEVALPAFHRQRLPNPALTLYEIHRWLLLTEKKEPLEPDSKDVSGIEPLDSSLLLPPAPDRALSKLDAEHLLCASDEFGIEAEKFGAEWITTIEKLTGILPSGLAYLSLYESDAYDFVITCLLVWAFAGLDLDSALRQADSAFILRHLQAGLRLLGSIMSTTSEEVCSKFLQSVSTPWHLINSMRSNHELPSAFHSQHMLINLLDSPLIATPIKVTAIRVLERSLCLSVGFRAFVGQPIATACIDERGEDQPTPYQRIVLFLSLSKSAPVALACHRLMAKVHIYELLLEFDELMQRLKSNTTNQLSTDAQLVSVRPLETYLIEISRLILDLKIVPPTSLKGLSRLKSAKVADDFYPVLYRLFSSLHLLDHLIWIIERYGQCRDYDLQTEAALDVLSALISTPSGLIFLASSPSYVTRLLRRILSGDHRDSRELIGLELAVKLEALSHIDALIAITRRKGCLSYISWRVSLDLEAKEDQTQTAPSDPVYDALFGLARLFLDFKFAPWVANLLASDDLFVPILMLLDAYDRHLKAVDAVHGVDNEADSVKPTATCGETTTEASQQERSAIRKSFISRLGYSSRRLEISSLLSIIGIGLLRYADNVSYLETFGSRLLQIVHSTPWEETISSLPPHLIFSHHRKFSDAAAPWLYWLRDFPQPPLHTHIETFSWLVDQMAPLADVLSHCLGSVNPSTAVVLPPALLVLLRLMCSHLRPNDDEIGERKLELIELYSRNGLTTLTALVECLADFILPRSTDSSTILASDMLELALEVLTRLVRGLLKVTGRGVGGEQFRDRSPVKALCRAYAVAVVRGCGEKFQQRIRKHILQCFTLYASACADTSSDKDAAVETDLWSGVCRDIFAFTASSPSFFLPGVQLLLDLLPLPLPIKTLKTLTLSEQKAISASRDWWCSHLACMPVEVCGLVEFLSPSPFEGPLGVTLRNFVDRITNLGSHNIALMLARSAVETLLQVYVGSNSASGVPSGDLSGEQQPAGLKEDSIVTTDQTPDVTGSGDLGLPPSTLTTTAANKLILGSSASLCLSKQPAAPAGCTTTDDQLTNARFANITDVSEILHSLCLLHFILSHPVCKQAFLDILIRPYGESDAKSSDKRTSPPVSQRLLVIFMNILEAHTDSQPHIEVQAKLVECIDRLLDANIGMARESNASSIENTSVFHLVDHLPPVGLLSDLVACLLSHLDHPKREVVSLPPVLRILHRLAVHDVGFVIIQRHLNGKLYERVLANVIRRVNESFSSESPDCRATLGLFLLLVSTLLGDPIFVEEARLAITDVEGTVSQCSSSDNGVLAEREFRLSTIRLRQLLRWSGAFEENRSGNPVEDLTSRLDILAEEQVSLRPLREGMKSLLNLLACVEDTYDQSQEECDLISLPLPNLPEPRRFTELYSPSFVVVIDKPEELAVARGHLRNMLPLTSSMSSNGSLLGHLKQLNVTEYAAEVCPGIDLNTELATSNLSGIRKRHPHDLETTIQHQRRRRGQKSSIIQTGRSAEKYVAPMRGRGFTIRQGASTTTGNPSSLLGPGVTGTASTGVRGDIFRSRPQNTSRPPSLHVDDFNKLEKSEPANSAASYGLDTSIRVRDANSFRGGRGGAASAVSSGGRVLSTLPFVGAATPKSCILPNPVAPAANPSMPWAINTTTAGAARSPNLLSLTNPTIPGRSSRGSLLPTHLE